MSFVLDASVTLAWVFPDETSATALRVRRRLEREAAIVPAIWSLEVTNAVLVSERRGRLSAAAANEALSILRELPIEIDEGTARAAWTDTLTIARANRLSTYDASYLEVALRREIPLATLDSALRKAAGRVKIKVL